MIISTLLLRPWQRWRNPCNCPWAYPGTVHPIFTIFCASYLWWHCDTLCTSGLWMTVILSMYWHLRSACSGCIASDNWLSGWLVPTENCDLAQRSFCTTFTNLQIGAIFAMTCNFCTLFHAYVQSVLRLPIVFDWLSMPKIDRVTGKPRSSMCLLPNSVKINSRPSCSSWSFLIKLAL